VIKGCKSILARIGNRSGRGVVLARDEQNDLALVKVSVKDAAALPFSQSTKLRLGQDVVVVGYPLRGILASSLNVTTGTVSSLAGIEDDSRFVQITAPVQPGNSGGPLLDQNGQIVGIVSSKLDAIGTAKLTGDIPQNINFALKGAVLRTFLDTTGVQYSLAGTPTPMETPVIADAARSSVALVECWKY
jgi:S1-C subfamily serine protease